MSQQSRDLDLERDLAFGLSQSDLLLSCKNKSDDARENKIGKDHKSCCVFFFSINKGIVNSLEIILAIVGKEWEIKYGAS